MNNTKQNKEKDKDALAAFAGISIFLAVLLIVFGVPRAQDSSDTANQISNAPTSEPLNIVLEASAEATELLAATPEATAELTEIALIVEQTPEATLETSTVVATSYSPEMIAQGEALFLSCSGCHGADARGIPGLGKDLVAGEFALAVTDEELFNFIITGRPIWDAANTTGIDMPARGGNPALSNDDIRAIVAYLRSLQGQ